MLADVSARFGQRVACQQKERGEWRTLTFEQTWRRATDFAAGLIALGLKKGDRVVIICENSPEWSVAYHGLSMAGGVGVPLYVELRSEEIEQLVPRSGARFIVASTRVLERLGDHLPGVEKVIVVGGTEMRAGQPPGFLRRGRPDHLPFDQVAAQASDVVAGFAPTVGTCQQYTDTKGHLTNTGGQFVGASVTTFYTQLIPTSSWQQYLGSQGSAAEWAGWARGVGTRNAGSVGLPGPPFDALAIEARVQDLAATVAGALSESGVMIPIGFLQSGRDDAGVAAFMDFLRVERRSSNAGRDCE